MYSARSYEGQLEAVHQHNLLNVNNAGGVNLVGAMDKVQSHDDNTQGSGSGSGYSDLSALENDTDDFGRQLLQHHKDAQRLNNAIHGQQAFRKARPNPRIAERLEREEQERDRLQGQNHARTSSRRSNESEPPVTVPREWGRRARKQTDWLRKIVAPSENGGQGREDDAIYQHRTTYTGDADWKDQAEVPFQSVEDTPPSMRRQRYDDTPSSLRHMNTTLKPLPDSDEQDFTAASFLASTPAPARYTRRIDELARREIEELESQAVATRTLEQMDQRSPNATLRRTSSTRLRERAQAEALHSSVVRPLSANGKSVSPSRIPIRRHNNKENERPTNGEVNGRHHESDGEALVNVTRGAQAVDFKKTPRPMHSRNDSMNLLKKLARVSSMSPSPAKNQEVADAVEARANGDGHSAEPVRRYDVQVRPSNVEDDVKHQDHRGQLDDGQKAALSDVDQTPMPQDSPPDAKTPVVAGAWVDTTLNGLAPLTKTNGAATTSVEPADDERIPAESELTQPKSALEAIIRGAKTEHDAQFGESTIQSLEDIVHPNLDQTDTFTLDLAPSNKIEEGNLDDGAALTQLEKDQRQEDLAMEAMNKHLRAARTGLKDANRGLRRVENKIETIPEGTVPSNSKAIVTATQPAGVIITSKSENIFPHYCSNCNTPYQSVWKALWQEFRSNFYTYTPSTKTGIRFTTLGLILLCFWLWYLTESTLCNIYCHPLYTYKIGKANIDPDAPIFPFVIPTLLFRPFRSLWGPWLEDVIEALGLWLNAVKEEVFFDHQEALVGIRRGEGGVGRRVLRETVGVGSAWVSSATGVAGRVVGSLGDAVDEMRMWDDELLI